MRGRATCRAIPKMLSEHRRRARRRRAGALDFGEANGQPVGRIRYDLVSLPRLLGECRDLLAQAGMSS